MANLELPLVHEHGAPTGSVDGPRPAVFVLHGRGADERDLLPVAERLSDGLHVISFRAPEPLMGGYTWYEIVTPNGDLRRSQPDEDDFRRSLDLVAESVDVAVTGYDLDPDRLGVLGFSQGAIMSFSLLLESPSRYAWCAGLHGYLAGSHARLDPPGIDGRPVFIGAGSADQIIPAERAKAAADRLSEIGCEVTYNEYDTSHGISHEELADLADWVDARTDS